MQTTQDKIIEYITKEKTTTPIKIEDEFGLSKAMIHRYLKRLVVAGTITKTGSAPRVHYSVNK